MKTQSILEFSEALETKMKEHLADFNVEQDELLKIGSLLTFIREIVRDLKAVVSAYTFQDETEEIKFFKEIKPVFVSQYMYYKKVFEIRLFDSFRDSRTRQTNYYLHLQKLEKFASRNADFYEYCMTNMTYLDKQYFTRNRNDSKSVDRDEKFSTGYDSKLAKLLTNESIKKFILTALKRSESSNHDQPSLTWTGPKASLIELIYALHSVEVFNKGSVEIKQIAIAFESVFNISLGNYYRVIQEIRLRKSGQTNFLDSLKGKLLKRLEEYDD